MSWESWPAFVFGWPAALAGAALLGVAVLKLRADLALVGALVAAGFLTYLVLNPPPTRYLGLGCLLANLACAVAVRLRKRRDAALWLLPYLVLLGWLAEATF